MSVIPKIPRASGGFAPLGPLPGFCPGPAGDLKTLAYSRPPLTTNPGSAPAYYMRSDNVLEYVAVHQKSLRS